MKIWEYRCYVDDRGNNVILNWLSGLSKKALAKFKRQLEILECLEIQDWHKPNPASLVKYHIYVIRFKDENRTQWRAYGHHDLPKKAFVLSFYGTEKDRKYDPTTKECIYKCTIRMEQCRTNWHGRTCACLSTSS